MLASILVVVGIPQRNNDSHVLFSPHGKTKFPTHVPPQLKYTFHVQVIISSKIVYYNILFIVFIYDYPEFGININYKLAPVAMGEPVKDQWMFTASGRVKMTLHDAHRDWVRGYRCQNML